MFARRGLLPLIEVIDRHDTATPLKSLSKGAPVLDLLGLSIDVGEPDLEVFDPVRQEAPARQVQAALSGSFIEVNDRQLVSGPAGPEVREGSVGGIERTSLISLTSEEKRTRPHMGRT